MLTHDAIISPCGKYRYSLTRRWGPGPVVVWIMLNPSIADHTIDDPTIRKCHGFTKRMGEYGGFVVVNLFAFRATDARVLTTVTDPVGPHNDTWLDQTLNRDDAGLRIVAWGGASKAKKLMTARALQFQNRFDHRFYCLGSTQDLHPRHPLMLAYKTPLERWR